MGETFVAFELRFVFGLIMTNYTLVTASPRLITPQAVNLTPPLRIVWEANMYLGLST